MVPSTSPSHHLTTLRRCWLSSSATKRCLYQNKTMEMQSKRTTDIDSLRDLASGAPVVRAVNDLLEKAIELRASDIHVEPFRTGLTREDARRRITASRAQLPRTCCRRRLISRIKILAGLNIAERRLPQDGAAHLHIARSEMDLRVATMPTRIRRIRRHPIAAKKSRRARHRKARLVPFGPKQGTQAARAPSWHHRPHRAYGKRQNHDTCDHADGT